MKRVSQFYERHFIKILMADLLQQLGHLAGASRFRRISEKLYLEGDKIYKEAGLHFRASWFFVYYVLAKSNQPLTIMEISDQVDFTHISVKNVLRELEKAELVNIEANPTDKRSKIVALSEKGSSLLNELEPLWLRFTQALKSLYDEGHPDLINMLGRIDKASEKIPLSERVKTDYQAPLQILDYRPDLKQYFYDLAAPWLKEVLNGTLEEEDEYTLNNPDKAYIETGGFLFFAKYKDSVAGCVVLKRLDEYSFEFAKLFIKPEYRKLGIASRLLDRCISRCRENYASELWLQTKHSMQEAHQLYYKLGFEDKAAPSQMAVLGRTEKIMCKSL